MAKIVRLVAGCALAVSSLVGLIGGAQPAQAVATFWEARVDASTNTAPKYSSKVWTPAKTGMAYARLEWTGGGDLRIDVRRVSDNSFIGGASSLARPKLVSASVQSGVAYRITVWAASGVGDFAVSLFDPVAAAGTVNAAGVNYDGTTWTPIASGSTQFVLNWVGNGTLRMDLRTAANNAVVATSSGTGNPQTITANVQVGTAYRVGVWTAAGVGDYTVAAIPTQPGVDSRPNILIILTDDQRQSAMQAMPKTKRWFGTEGTTFPNGYVTTPSCCPSRASILTGRYVHNNGVRTQAGPAFDETTSVARYLKDAGYNTGYVGKYVHYYDLSARAPYWDRWTYWKGAYNDVYMNFDGVVRQSKGYSTTIAFDTAIEYVASWEQRDGTPWMMVVAPTAPHKLGTNPPDVEPQYANATVPPMPTTPATFEADRSDKPPFLDTGLTPAYNTTMYNQMTRAALSIDDGVDRLMRQLRANGELDNTLAIFLSDNGWMQGDHGYLDKFTPYTNSVEVPFLVRWPGHAVAGATDNRFVANVDIAPTVLTAAGAAGVSNMDGRNIFAGTTRNRRLTEYFVDSGNNPSIRTWASITTTTYTYTEYYSTDGTQVRFREYYNLVNDPYELVNLFNDGNAANDPNVATIAAQLATDRGCVRGACP